jgi:hypothetical protein
MLIFDVDGTVAKWCIANDGKGKILGGSAVTPTDPKFEYRPPRMEYVGFRVVIKE